jgi:hypothetical protein
MRETTVADLPKQRLQVSPAKPDRDQKPFAPANKVCAKPCGYRELIKSGRIIIAFIVSAFLQHFVP